MRMMVQKKISIKPEQEAFLATFRQYGFADQSSMIRAALDNFIKEINRKQRRAQIAQKAVELVEMYDHDSDLTTFTAIDGDDFYEAGGNLGNKPESCNRGGDTESASGGDHK